MSSKNSYRYEVEEKVKIVLSELSNTNVYVDKECVNGLKKGIQEEYNILYEEIKSYLGDVNINSSKEIGRKFSENKNRKILNKHRGITKY